MKISSSQFNFHKGQLVACLSDLERFRFSQLYTDSPAMGLTIVSATTGAEVDFAIAQELREGGEITSWLLTPTRESVRAVPSSKKTTVLLFND